MAKQIRIGLEASGSTGEAKVGGGEAPRARHHVREVLAIVALPSILANAFGVGCRKAVEGAALGFILQHPPTHAAVHIRMVEHEEGVIRRRDRVLEVAAVATRAAAHLEGSQIAALGV